MASTAERLALQRSWRRSLAQSVGWWLLVVDMLCFVCGPGDELANGAKIYGAKEKNEVVFFSKFPHRLELLTSSVITQVVVRYRLRYHTLYLEIKATGTGGG